MDVKFLERTQARGSGSISHPNGDCNRVRVLKVYDATTRRRRSALSTSWSVGWTVDRQMRQALEPPPVRLAPHGMRGRAVSDNNGERFVAC
jgi:hypothetical protein